MYYYLPDMLNGEKQFKMGKFRQTLPDMLSDRTVSYCGTGNSCDERERRTGSASESVYEELCLWIIGDDHENLTLLVQAGGIDLIRKAFQQISLEYGRKATADIHGPAYDELRIVCYRDGKRKFLKVKAYRRFGDERLWSGKV